MAVCDPTCSRLANSKIDKPCQISLHSPWGFRNYIIIMSLGFPFASVDGGLEPLKLFGSQGARVVSAELTFRDRHPRC